MLLLLNWPRHFAFTYLCKCAHICLLKTQDKEDERHTCTAANKYSVHRVLCSAQTNAHTQTQTLMIHYKHICWKAWAERQRWLMIRIRSPQRFRLPSEQQHICQSPSLCSPFNYIFIFVVAEWHIEPWSATDPNPELTKIEHPPYPTVSPLFPHLPPILHPPLRLMQIFLLWYHFPFFGRWILPFSLYSVGDMTTRWKQVRLTRTHEQTNVCRVGVEKAARVGVEEEESGADRWGRRSREVSHSVIKS